ncbi:neutral zinc metallopeptidase [Croceibacterium mercuriale]|uniref:Neutral zinc metallopeptidase n=1 Tax=Croceibacterium mercuriale TaxID=1572751 RepID=A0A0B2C3B3_9SPHN|nr:neutral zinc metallopeptidase [Croceibacterium mercuriale]
MEEIEQLAHAALRRIPAPFADHLTGVRLLVEDYAEAAVLTDLGIEDPFELTGLYEGLPLGDKSIDHSGAMPDRIRLFRRPILDEWAERGDITLEHLVAHVLVHEVGHHFGLSDAAMHALEDEAG